MTDVLVSRFLCPSTISVHSDMPCRICQRCYIETGLKKDSVMSRPVYAFGAYGTNNVGDEAIFYGLRKLYPSAFQVYVNKSDVNNSVWYADILEGRHSLPSNTLGIIGGGGLLHSYGAVSDYIKFVKLVLGSGGTAEMRSVGAEGVAPDFKSAVTDLVRLCERVTVRTRESQRIIFDVSGVTAELEEDFALRLDVPACRSPRAIDSEVLPTIGVSVGMSPFLSDGAFFKNLVERYTIENGPVNFVFIPHSHSFVDVNNNDLLTYEYFWSSINIYHSTRERRVRVAKFTTDPEEVLRTYALLDGIIGERFHSIVFGHMLNIPTLALCHSKKNESFILDNPRQNLYVVRNQDDEVTVTERFMARVLSGVNFS